MRSNSHHPNGLDEAALVSRAVKGDSEAFGTLYSRYMDAIYRYIFFRVGEDLEAEDLTEEVFIRAWEALPEYQIGEHPFKSWLYRIAHNLVVDHHRKQRPVSIPDLDLHHHPDTAPSHEEGLVSKQDAAHLAYAVQQLSDEEQQVVILRFVEGLSHREVAELIGKTEGACRVIQHRALAALHDHLSRLKQLE